MLSGRPRVDLVGGPTPLQHMARIGRVAGHDGLFVKRDDCMALGLGGNKVRSLEYWIGEALAQGCDMLAVAGGLASNQCRLTAAAGAKLGLDVLVIYAGDPGEPLRGNALIAERMGATIRRLGPVSEDERGALSRAAVAGLVAAGRRPYLIGEPVTGALGYMRAAEELAAQDSAQGRHLRHIVVPGSMGPTEAGLIFGAAVLDLPWTFHLVSVEYDAHSLRRRLAAIMNGLAERLDCPTRDDALARVRIHMDQLGAGYGVPHAASREAAALFARHEALLLEQTYVAKTFAGLLALAADGRIPGDEAACILHTGGTPSIFEQD